MKPITRRAPYLLALSLVFSVMAKAEEITVRFDGIISETFGDPWNLAGFNIGQQFIATYTFESSTPADNSTTMFGGIPSKRSVYPYAIRSFSASSNGVTFTSAGTLQNGIIIDDNLDLHDSYYALLASDYSELYLDLRSKNTGLFSSQAIPINMPSISEFNYTTMFRLRNSTQTGGYTYAAGQVNSISVVPEPATLFQFLMGSVFLFGFIMPIARQSKVKRFVLTKQPSEV